MSRVLVGVKRVIDYAVKVSLAVFQSSNYVYYVLRDLWFGSATISCLIYCFITNQSKPYDTRLYNSLISE